jgi:hypothetical protein
MFDLDLSHINVNEFCREAQTFVKNEERYGRGNGFYIDCPRDSREWTEYWDLQEFYCKNGFSVGGVKITGEHYFYLNFCQIELKKETQFIENVNKQNKRKVDSIVTFPAFWDSDWYYFTESFLARENGQHMIVLKPRRRGYSYKNAAKCAYNYTFQRKSNSIILAEDKKYSEETMGMAVDYLDFLIKYTDFGHPRMHVDRRKVEIQSSYEEITPDGRKVTGGFFSRIMQFSAKNNPDVARGKAASVILFEEAGSFSNLLSTYKITRATVEQSVQVSGTIYVYGTGGDFSGGQVDFEKMFYSPEEFNFRAYNNIYEEGKESTSIGYFLPDYYSKGGFIKEETGESLVEEAKSAVETQVEFIKKNSKDPNALDSHLAEFPIIPAHAFIKIGTNIFPKAEINAQINEIQSNGALQNIGKRVIFYKGEDGRLKCDPSDDVKPIMNFPLKKEEDGEGCVLIYQEPYKVSGEIPSNLYYICCDPYAFDKTSGDSIGAAYVLKNINPFSTPDDIIVAEYIARPMEGQDEFNKNLFHLAEYYNAKIAAENDRGNILEYSKTNGLRRWLENEFDVYDNNDNIARRLNRGYGMSMNNRETKLQGMMYLRQWLLKPRGEALDGEKHLNVHKIYSIPLLKELLAFDPDKGNYDRVSSLFIGMYYRKQLAMTPIRELQKSIYEDELFINLKNKIGISQTLD